MTLLYRIQLLAQRIHEHDWESALFIDGEEMDVNFQLAVRNLHGFDVLPQIVRPYINHAWF